MDFYFLISSSIYPYVKKFSDRFEVTVSSDAWVDVINKGVSKASALVCIEKEFGIKPEECAAFGDYLNDVELLEAVGYGFAMANAKDEVKKIARYETASNKEHGVIKGIRRLMEQGLC